jgi:hypothetical protein
MENQSNNGKKTAATANSQKVKKSASDFVGWRDDLLGKNPSKTRLPFIKKTEQGSQIKKSAPDNDDFL